MNTIYILGIILFVLMTIIGKKQGIITFLTFIFNLGVLFLDILGIKFHFSPVIVTIISGIIILATSIFWRKGNDSLSSIAFYSSIIVTAILLILIELIEYKAKVYGFGKEDTASLEGLSLYIGLPLYKIEICTIILSTLGATADTAITIVSGLGEIKQKTPKITQKQLFSDGLQVGNKILSTTFNTLFFGFFGGFLALFIWFVGLHYSIGQVLNDKIFVRQLLMILVAFIGVLLIVPISSFLASLKLSNKGLKNNGRRTG